jgi:hypothetical protein
MATARASQTALLLAEQARLNAVFSKIDDHVLETALAGDEEAQASSGAAGQAELEIDPRRATHDGQCGTSSSSPLGTATARPPKSEPPARGAKVRWAPGVSSPRATRHALHKRSREREAPTCSSESVAAGATTCRESVPAVDEGAGRGKRVRRTRGPPGG